MSSRLLKFVISCHRWLGVLCCLLFVLWFASGIVMMYWGFPEVGLEERLRSAESLTPEAIRISPEAAYQTLRRSEPPDQARLTMLDGRPVYRFRIGRSETGIYADSGELAPSVSPEMALRIAARWTGQPAANARFEGSLNDADQWTVSGEYRELRPLLKYAWPDGDEAYVSARRGEVVQATTRESRIAAYFGAIPHWLYWTPLRKNGRMWSRVVTWSSGIATIVSLLGLFVGVRMYSPHKRYGYRSEPSAIPYRGQKRWHMILGLTFGTLACTWTFSGLLSMEPFEWLSQTNQSVEVADDALRGGKLNLTAFSGRTPGEALQLAGPDVKEIELIHFGGEPYYLTRQSGPISRIVPIRGAASEQFDPVVIEGLISRASRPASIAETRVLYEYDAYYLDRHRLHPLPALFVRLNDAGSSTFYIDLKTAQIVEAYDDRTRWNRWLYHGLHSWNFPWLYRNRPAWDILVLALLVGGTSLSVTAVLLGFELLRGKLRLARATIDDTGVATP